MGYVRVKGFIGRAKEEAIEAEFLVNTGAFYTILPPNFAEKLKLRPMMEIELMLADKRRTKAGLTVAYMGLLDREGGFPVAIMNVPEPILGITVLEGLGLKADPATGKLEYSRPYGLAAI